MTEPPSPADFKPDPPATKPPRVKTCRHCGVELRPWEVRELICDACLRSYS